MSKHVACSYGYRLVCVDDKFSKSFKLYVDENVVCNFISSMVQKVDIVAMWWKNMLTKNLWSLKKIIKILRTLLNVGSAIMIILMVMLKEEIIAISLENVEVLHIQIEISMLN